MDGEHGRAGPQAHVRTTLLVDDHHAFADLMALALGNEPDFEILGIAPSARAAIDMAIRHRPQMVLMDVELGGSSGIDATRTIRDALPEVVVVIVSAHGDSATIAR